MEAITYEYKVSFWFGDAADNAETNPDKVIYVMTQSREKREIIQMALKEVGTYPRSYQVKVEEADTIELYVVRITNSKNANLDAWYANRDGELFVVQESKHYYSTYHFLGNTGTIGHIPKQFCEVVTSFNTEDTF